MASEELPDPDRPEEELALPGLRHILDAKPDLLADAANALTGLGKDLSRHAREFKTEVLPHLSSQDPGQRAAAADSATRLGREVAGDIERLRMIGFSITEALPGPDPVAEAMEDFCRQWEGKLRSLQWCADKAAALLGGPDPQR